MKKYKLLMLLGVIGVILTACMKINLSFQNKNWEVLSVEETENSRGMKRTLYDFDEEQLLEDLYDLEFQRERSSKQNDESKFTLNINVIDSSNEGERIDIIAEDTISYEGDIYNFHEVNNLEGLSLTTKQENYTNDIDSIQLVFDNKRSNQFTFGKEIKLEIEEDGIWYQVFPSDDLAWNDIGIILNGNSTIEEDIPLTAYKNYLDNGHYRFVKVVYMQEDKTTSAYVLAAEFYVNGEDKKATDEKVLKKSDDYYLELDSSDYVLDLTSGSQEILYTIYNNTEKTASYVAIPTLEKKTENGWDNEFIVYWLPLMQDNPYNLITFQEESYTDSAKLSITPEPDSILRVFMVYKPLNDWINIEEQQLKSFQREGFSVIEWGGANIEE